MPERDHYRRTSCRLCGATRLTLSFALTPTPPANAFVCADELDQAQPTYPLELFLCDECGHLQLLDVVNARLLFENYVYVSGTSPKFVDHFREYAAEVAAQQQLARGDLVVEIGSNDGTLLRFFKEAGARTLGIDPAREIAARATENGIETWPTFFSPAVAAEVKAQHGSAGLVCANNVFAHIDDLSGAVEGIRTLLSPHGSFVFEVSYLLDVFNKTLFDTIYHEHLDYHRVGPLRRFFRANGMELVDVKRVDTHGGSMRGFVRILDGSQPVGPAVDELEAVERDAGLHDPATYRQFAARIEASRRELTALLRGLKDDGQRIAGYGAPAKATTLMYHFGLGSDVIEFIVDDSPWKEGLYTPGLHVPVVAPSALYERPLDYVVVLAWNFAEQIIAQHAAFAEAGGRFIVPLPKLQVR